MNISTAYPPSLATDLVGRPWPDVELPATNGAVVNLRLLKGLTVVYAYPRTSPPDGASVPGWAEIPGAKGCTPQSCGFRDHFAELQAAGATHVFGMSTQSTAYQQEVANRLHLPFALLSDADLAVQSQIGLPMFAAGGMTLLHRLTLIVNDGVVERVFHSIADPVTNAADVLVYLSGDRR